MKAIEKEWFNPHKERPKNAEKGFMKNCLMEKLQWQSPSDYDTAKERTLEHVRASFSLAFENPAMLDYTPKRQKWNTYEFTFSDEVPVLLERKTILYYFPITVKTKVKSRYAPKRIFYLDKPSKNQLENYELEVDFSPSLWMSFYAMFLNDFPQSSPMRTINKHFQIKRAQASVELPYWKKPEDVREIIVETVSPLYQEIRDSFFCNIKEQFGLNGFIEEAKKHRDINWTEVR